MARTFSEVKMFQVKPDKVEDFEELIKKLPKNRKNNQAPFLSNI